MWPDVAPPSDRQVRSFARVWLPVFSALVGLSLMSRHGLTTTTALVITGLVTLSIICAASIVAARWMFVALQVATRPVAVVVSTVVLALVFYLVVTPIGLALRMTGRDPLRLRARQSATHWLPPLDDHDPERAFRQF